MRFLFVAGSPHSDSRSRRLAAHARDHAVRAFPDAEVDWLDLATDAPEPFRGFDEDYGDATQAALRAISEADAYVLASPVFNGSTSSALKNLFEHVDYKALEGRVAGFVLVGGGSISFLQARSHLESLMTYFRVRVVPRGAYATADQVDARDEKILRRVERLVDDVAAEARAHAPPPPPGKAHYRVA